ncbi:MAG: DUF1311 domain-containing protein [Comamonadaceae bacterium]|nr:MAG: DUF1311 domain-containing protein [Comamonadaceae bacterium]
MSLQKKHVGIAAAAGALAMFASVASAQTAGDFMQNPAFADPPPKQCNSTVDMQHCAAHELRVADAKMSANYKAKRAGLDQAGKQKLLQEQRKWLKARDQNCMAKAKKYAGGSMSGVAVAQCWVDVTKLRAEALAK